MKKMNKNLIILLFLICGFTRCISPVDRDVEQPLNILVVEGFIDDDFGPHEIEVSLLANFASIAEGGNKRPVEADVRIFDDLGNSFPLTRETFIREDLFNPNPPGCSAAVGELEVTTNYMTSSTFRGIPGRSYALEVITSDRTVYRSNLQELPTAVPLDSVFVEFVSLASGNDLVPTTGVDVYAAWQDNAEVNNFHFWDVDGTYRIATPDRTDGIVCCLYDPRDQIQADDCWVVERNLPGTVRAFENRFSPGQFTVQRIGFIEDNGRRFSNEAVVGDMRYHVQVHQYTVTQEAFEFLNNIQTLSEINGEIFDPPPVGARGNIINIEDPDELVAGFFGVHGVSSTGIFVKRSDLESVKQHSLCGDCRFFAGGQFEIPEPYQ